MNKRLFLLALLCALYVSESSAQESFDNVLGSDRSSWVDKVYVGGGLGGFGISDRQVWVNISGQVGYRITPNWNAGIGLTYQYFKYKEPINQSFNDYGINFYTQYVVYKPFFLMAQYEIFFLDLVEGGHTTYNTFLLGAGISQPMGNKGFLNFYALYNVFYSEGGDNGRYDSPWVIGMNFGIGF
ncbi:hypothetical protein [Reichenbachiella sp.]|uniref:hypothetical protein n=1 Tax=Reichenbachiella sp. TaxID=2184521 RepID=UPI003B5A3DC6